jgi:hypothetical protein
MYHVFKMISWLGKGSNQKTSSSNYARLIGYCVILSISAYGLATEADIDFDGLDFILY